MTAAKKTGQAAVDRELPGREAAELELARQPAERAQAEGLALTGPGGLLGRLTKVVLEGALEGEMDAHLGYAKHDPAGRDGGNSRNGHRDKTVLTDVGPVVGAENLRQLGRCFTAHRRLGYANGAWRLDLGSSWCAMIFGLWA